MSSLDKANEPKFYNFFWELKGYDCGPLKIRSQVFKVSFEVTEWYVELDFSKLQSIDSCILFRLQRMPDVGPRAVILDVKVTMNLKENKLFNFEKSQIARVFSEKGVNFLAFEIHIPSQRLESKENNLSWLTSKSLLLNVEMKSPERTDPEFSKRYWHTDASLQVVMNDLKTLYSTENFHDLVLKDGEKEFKLHKCMLNVRWPKLVSTIGIGKRSAGLETKEFSGIPHAIMEHLLKFAYYGDLQFMYELEEIDDSIEVFNSVKKYNFYRLNDQIAQLSPKCSSSQVFQCYKTSLEMKFENVTSTNQCMGDFKTFDVPLKPRILPRSKEPLDVEEMEKFQRHIRFVDVQVYVDKGPLGYNWLMFSMVLGKIPKENPVTVACKLYVIGENKAKYLLTEQKLVFDKNTEISFSTTFSKGKISKRYLKISEPIITWKELIDERNNFMWKRKITDPLSEMLEKLSEQKSSVQKKLVTDPSSSKFEMTEEQTNLLKEKLESATSNKPIEEKDIHFRLELKLSDGEYLCETRLGQHEFWYEGDYKIFQDLELMLNDDTFTDIKVTSGERGIKAHKAILASRSPKLAKAILGKRIKSLEINIEPEYLYAFIHYLYTGQIREIPVDKIEHLISVADEYGMDCLKRVLEERKYLDKGVIVA